MVEPSMEIGFSNETLLITSLLGFTLLFASLACLCHFSPSQAKYDERDGANDDDDGDNYDRLLEDADVSTLNRAQRKARAKLLMKKKRKKHNNNNNEQQQGGDDGVVNAADVDEQQEHNEINEGQDQGQTSSLSRKERQKAAKEEERLYRREYEEIRKLKIKDEMERREAKEQRLKEKKELVELEKQKAQEEELQSWKYMFGGSSSTAVRRKDDESNRMTVTVDEFVKELNETQVIKLNDTAIKFQVSVEELVDRLKQLEEEGRIEHGIIDTKRKIYFSVDQATMKQISELIKEKEAVTLDDITKEVTRIILHKEQIS